MKKSIPKKKWLTWISMGGGLLAVACLILPILLYLITEDFEGKTVFTLCFLVLGGERLWFSLFTSKDKKPFRVTEDWTFIAVGLSFTLMMYGVIFEFYFGSMGLGWYLSSGVGFMLIGLSIFFRYWAVKSLGDQWAIHLENIGDKNRYLVKSGPYAIVRHPIYFAAMMEVVGIPLFFNAYKTIFFPLYLHPFPNQTDLF